jgi:hypothetical protein
LPGYVFDRLSPRAFSIFCNSSRQV